MSAADIDCFPQEPYSRNPRPSVRRRHPDTFPSRRIPLPKITIPVVRPVHFKAQTWLPIQVSHVSPARSYDPTAPQPHSASLPTFHQNLLHVGGEFNLAALSLHPSDEGIDQGFRAALGIVQHHTLIKGTASSGGRGGGVPILVHGRRPLRP